MEKGKNLSSVKDEAVLPSPPIPPSPGLTNLELREYGFYLDDLI